MRRTLWAIGIGIPAAAIAAGGVVWLYYHNPDSCRALPQCTLHEWTGLYCCGCGTTRALYALLHGNFYGFFRNNLLLTPALAAATAIYIHPKLGTDRRFLFGLLGVILGYTILRNLPWPPFTLLAPLS